MSIPLRRWPPQPVTLKPIKKLLPVVLLASVLTACGGGTSTPGTSTPNTPAVPSSAVAPKLSGFVLSGSQHSLTVNLNAPASCVFNSAAGSLNMTAATLEGSPYAYAVSLSGSYPKASVTCTNSAGSDTLSPGNLSVG